MEGHVIHLDNSFGTEAAALFEKENDMLTEKQHQEWKKDLIELHKLRAENKRLKEVLGSLHFCCCGCNNDNIKAVKQALKG